MTIHILDHNYTFLHFKRRPNDAKNNKKCKINSRNFTLDKHQKLVFVQVKG